MCVICEAVSPQTGLLSEPNDSEMQSNAQSSLRSAHLRSPRAAWYAVAAAPTETMVLPNRFPSGVLLALQMRSSRNVVSV
jgi:hypothetical protein